MHMVKPEIVAVLLNPFNSWKKKLSSIKEMAVVCKYLSVHCSIVLTDVRGLSVKEEWDTLVTVSLLTPVKWKWPNFVYFAMFTIVFEVDLETRCNMVFLVIFGLTVNKIFFIQMYMSLFCPVLFSCGFFGYCTQMLIQTS